MRSGPIRSGTPHPGTLLLEEFRVFSGLTLDGPVRRDRVIAIEGGRG